MHEFLHQITTPNKKSMS